MVSNVNRPKGELNREAVDALKGYVYQIYQSVLAWLELKADEQLFLEVAEDYAIAASDALSAIQVKETKHNVTINSDDIIASIDAFVRLRQENPSLEVKLRHLTTSKIAKEKSPEHRIGDEPTLVIWRKLAKAGKLEPLRKILVNSKLSKRTKRFIQDLDDISLRDEFLKRIHFDCGALNSEFIERQLRSKLLVLLKERGGSYSQVENCFSILMMTVLQKATQKEHRYLGLLELEEILENVTKVQLNRSQFEMLHESINRALSQPTVSSGTNILETRIIKPRPINEVPFPIAIASRTEQIDAVINALTKYGISWIYGAAGVGKTLSAKVSARKIGGVWISVNLRGLKLEQINSALSETANMLTEQKIDGVLVDDLEDSNQQTIIEMLLYLFGLCTRADIMILITSSTPPASGFLFNANLPTTIGQTVAEFTQQDIKEILEDLDIRDEIWIKYVHMISGGHPQLTVAFIQNMAANGWPREELQTWDSLFKGNPIIEQVRRNARERLLSEIPDCSRRLIERLSLKSGGFSRELVLDIAQLSPAIQDAGALFEQLIGSWVDQHSSDRFYLSPLLSDYAASTLSSAQKQAVNFAFASILTKTRQLDVIEVNAILIAAIAGKNTHVIKLLCFAIFQANQETLEMIATHFTTLLFMRTDTQVYTEDLLVNMLMRGSQLILACHDERSNSNVVSIMESFKREASYFKRDQQTLGFTFMVYTKILLFDTKVGYLPEFLNLIQDLDFIIEEKDNDLSVLFANEMASFQQSENIVLVGFLFFNQIRQIKRIADLLPVFKFLDICDEEQRGRFLNYKNNALFEVDQLVAPAWLSEFKDNTIDPLFHSNIYAQLHDFAKSWGQFDLAIICLKYQSIIIDETGNDKDKALEVIQNGMSYYGQSNSELIRAKAKILYRADEHQESLKLSRGLIDNGLPLSKTEKVFLGRETAISAEKQHDFEAARKYYLYASDAASDCDSADMIPMRIGLQADAALASWHAGNREGCLREFVDIFNELNGIKPTSSLLAAHRHVICRHLILWLEQDVTGLKKFTFNGEDITIFPGMLSITEPHPEITKQFIMPIEMVWYMLMRLENYCLVDAGITRNANKFLVNGPIQQGIMMLAPALLNRAMIDVNVQLFLSALQDTIALFASTDLKDKNKTLFEPQNLIYGDIPKPTHAQKLKLTNLAEMFVLSFLIKCIFTDKLGEYDTLIDNINEFDGVIVRDLLIESAHKVGGSEDYNLDTATLLFSHKKAIEEGRKVTPSEVFRISLKALELAKEIGHLALFAEVTFNWLSNKWNVIWASQRALLRNPRGLGNSVEVALENTDYSWIIRLACLMQAILPTIGFNYDSEHNINQFLTQLKDL